LIRENIQTGPVGANRASRENAGGFLPLKYPQAA